MVRFKVRTRFRRVLSEPKLTWFFKNRWLLVELIPCPSTSTTSALDVSAPEDNAIGSKHIWSALKQSVIANFGDTGWGAISSSLTSELSDFSKWRSTERRFQSNTTLRQQMCVSFVLRETSIRLLGPELHYCLPSKDANIFPT